MNDKGEAIIETQGISNPHIIVDANQTEKYMSLLKTKKVDIETNKSK